MGLGEYNGAEGGGDFADDEKILYRLVPQKKGALVQFDTVSYTHLNIMRHTNHENVNLDLTDANGVNLAHVNLADFLAANPVVDPVSYTHLDVYKRQNVLFLPDFRHQSA